ncbi:hypothetical protein VTJ83DRAFT_3869 [Remersonia thermophila]|uniref:PHD-type domain-containing protein n=1 Tax=Remersonia thermophila TaxID=72144 RepID=A0ABR4DF75_9PEZI
MMAFSSSLFVPDLAADASAATAPASKKDSPNSQTHHPEANGAASLASMSQAESAPSAPDATAMDHDMADDVSVNGTTTPSASKASAASAASKKKKGTASAVKPTPKRTRPGPGGAKKTKSGPSKRTRPSGATRPNGDPDGGNSTDSDNGPYCLCRGPDDHRFMIACDRCEDWFHGECIGMDKHTGENLVQRYICPNCSEGGRYTTRYKKMCSLAGCMNPARIYDPVRPSIFCSPDHCQAWWEQLIATLPRTKDAAPPDVSDWLTQDELIGLLDAPAQPPPAKDEHDLPPTTPWRLGQKPFATPPDFWDSPASARALTAEEHELLTTSAAARHRLGEEIVLCKKMLQLIDMALKQREAAIAAGKGTAKDLCGYDSRLDTVGATHQFARFLQSPQAEAIFAAGRLDGPLLVPPPPTGTETGTEPAIHGTNGTNGTNGTHGTSPPLPPDGDGAGAGAGAGAANGTLGDPPDDTFPHMCTKKKCKPHNGWSAILTKAVRHDMKELAAQAKEMLDAEQRVRDGAAGRFQRRLKERNRVVVVGAPAAAEAEAKAGAGVLGV